MRTFRCSNCSNQLFFDNSVCMKCKREVGWCPICEAIVDVTTHAGGFCCAACSTSLVKCSNYASYNVCNRFIASKVTEGSQGETSQGVFCDCCRFNHTIPDLSVEGNKEKWYRLEAAKRRTMYDLNILGFPYGTQQDRVTPGLGFEFKADIIRDHFYRGMSGDGQKIYTGHDNGIITINIQEADDVEREKLRVMMGESHRSLLGHFRHEFGHYIWDVLIKGHREPDSIAVFGDHNNPAYDQALQDYYKNGPKSGWLPNYVSAYATMHPWEDFAETFLVYLDMTSALDTAWHGGLIPEPACNDLDAMVDAYQKLGVALNEMNRSVGLLDFLPELLADPVREKLRFIHGLTHTKAPAPQVVAAAGAAVSSSTN